MSIDKVATSAAEVVAEIASGASLAVGGFGLVGIPWFLIAAVLEQGADDLTVVSNNYGVDGAGLGRCSSSAGSAGSLRPTSARTRSSPGSISPAS